MFPQFVDESFENKVLEISQEEYHARRDCVHSSSLKNIIDSPHAYNYFIKNPIKETESMRLGTIIHEFYLEGDLALSRYIVEPLFSGLTKDGVLTTSANATSVKQAKSEWYANLPHGAKVMSQTERDKLMFMIDSLLNHKFVQEVFKDGLAEYKKQWRDPSTGLACISSDDFISFKNNIFVELKTTPSSKWENFRKNGVERLNYPFQYAFYNRGHKEVLGRSFSDRVWVAQENTAPWSCRVHFIDDFYAKAGEIQVARAMRDLRTSLINDSWPQGQQIIESGDPSYFYKKEFELEVQDHDLKTEGIS